MSLKFLDTVPPSMTGKKWIKQLGLLYVVNSIFLSFFGWFGRFEVQFWRTSLGSVGSRFRIFRFVLIPNDKFTQFMIFYLIRTFGSVRG